MRSLFTRDGCNNWDCCSSNENSFWFLSAAASLKRSGRRIRGERNVPRASSASLQPVVRSPPSHSSKSWARIVSPTGDAPWHPRQRCSSSVFFADHFLRMQPHWLKGNSDRVWPTKTCISTRAVFFHDWFRTAPSVHLWISYMFRVCRVLCGNKKGQVHRLTFLWVWDLLTMCLNG